MTSAPKRKNKRHNYFDGKKTDKNIKFCKKCKRCWEMDFIGNVIHYKDFPTYKKERQVCSICKNNQGAHVS